MSINNLYYILELTVCWSKCWKWPTTGMLDIWWTYCSCL